MQILRRMLHHADSQLDFAPDVVSAKLDFAPCRFCAGSQLDFDSESCHADSQLDFVFEKCHADLAPDVVSVFVSCRFTT
jgi:hypothetical protein